MNCYTQSKDIGQSKIQLDHEQNNEKIGKKKKEFLERKIGGKKNEIGSALVVLNMKLIF